jgi:hypothetical protein
MLKWQAKATNLEKKLEAYKTIDPEEYKNLKEEVTILRRENAEGDPKKIDEVITKERTEIENKFRKQYGDSIEALKKEKQEISSELDRLRVVNPAMLKAADVFNSTELSLIQMLIEKDLAFKDGQIIVKDEKGEPKLSPTNPRQLMSIDEYMEGLTAKYPGCAKPRGTAGSREAGTTRSAQGTKTENYTVTQYLNMTREQQLQIPLAERGKLAEQALKMT